METEEVIKLVDGIYKNILDKFNPGARQLISAGKAYLKALHGAAAASRLFNEALAKIAVNAQQGGTTDIGSALMSIVGVYKEIQDQHMNILKAFYVDLLVPLETNLEKDTKVVQFEQKKFLQQHKIRADSYSKATATMKKQRKKKNNSQSAEKEIKSIQAMEEEKNKLDAFCEQSLKNAMTQERRRYGFVLERQCSLAKHWMAYHSAGRAEIENSLDNWGDVAGTREFLPPNVENIFKKRMRESMNDDNSDRGSINSALRKTRSIDASCMDMRSIGDVVNNTINRAKSEYNLTFTNSSIQPEVNHWDQRPVARALYAYLSSGENQLSFLESDRIALVGERAKGWQFGENLRTQMFGWFPLAYTESESDDNPMSNWESKLHRNDVHTDNITPDSSLESTLVDDPPPPKMNSYHNEDASPTRMFGDTIMYRQSKQFRRVSGGPPPPPTLPAPVPTPVVPPYSKNHHLSQSHSFSSSGGPPVIEKRKPGPATMNLSKPVGNKVKSVRDGVTNASLHSSNDSGFANEPPPQPEVDYSDEETVTRIPLRSPRHEKLITSNVHIPRQSQQRRSNDDSADMTLSRSIDSSNHIRQSSSFGNLTDESTIDFMYRTSDRGGNLIKRTKSFWKFGKSDDILEGMALWKHRDLVQTEDEKNDEKIKETTLKRNRPMEPLQQQPPQQQHRIENNIEIMNNINNNHNSSSYSNSNSTNSSETLKNGRSHNTILIEETVKFPITKSDIDHRISKHNEDNIYGIAPLVNNNHINSNTNSVNQQQQQQQTLKSKQSQQSQQTQQKQQNRQSYINIEKDETIDNRRSKQPQTRQTYINIEKEEIIDNRKSQPQQTRQNYINNNIEKEETIDRRSRKQKMYINNHQNDQDDMMIMKKKGGGQYYDSQENLHMIDDMSLINNDSMRMHETNFYDDECMQDVMMKTVKRKEILKQYYNSSGTDTEQNSSSSDPYDCIVVDDHLVRKDNGRKKTNGTDKMEFTTFRGADKKDIIINDTPRTGTLLPRTKLVKATSVGPVMQTAMLMDKEKEIRDAEEQKRNSKNRNSSKAYGPWYDLWGNDASVKK